MGDDTAVDGTTDDAGDDGAPDSTLDVSDVSEVSDGADATADADVSADVLAETAPDVSDAGDGGDADATIDTTPDTSTDADAIAEVAPDTAYDAFFTPPTWSPVCVPTPPPPSDGGVDADAADTADTTADDADADAGADAGSDADGGDADEGSVAPDADDADADFSGDADAAEASVTDADVATDVGADARICSAVRVRIVASNLTSGSSPVYDSPGIHILQALHPDIALMQEFKYGSSLRALVDLAFGPTYNIVTEIDPGAIPNGIVSRYPIIESGEWDDPDLTDRDWVWARIDVPGSIDLFAVSTHLRTTSASARDAEAKNLVAYVKAKVPAGVYLVIGGDFNTAIATEIALLDLAEVVSVSAPYAVDQAGIPNTNAPRNKPYDWVLPNPLLLARMIPVAIGSASYPAGLVFDSRVYSPLSDVAPVLSTDSAATNMQHMAVARDFALGD